MKKAVLIIASFFILVAWIKRFTAIHVVKVAASEYLRADLYSDGSVRAYINDVGASVHYVPYNFGGRTAIDIAPGFNHVLILDDLHRPWINTPTGTPATNNSCTMYTTDSAGNAMNHFGSIYAYAYAYFAVSLTNDTIYHWADQDSYGWVDGTKIRQVKAYPLFIAPSGRTIKKMSVGLTALILLDNGDVYGRATGGSSFTKYTLPAGSYAVDISSSYRDFMCVLLHNYAGGNANEGVIAWMGSESGYFGDNNSRSNPFVLGWSLPYHFKSVACNDNSCAAIDSSGDMYGWGDNAGGEVGKGTEIVNRYNYQNFCCVTPYAWSTDKLQDPVTFPVKIGGWTKWKYIADNKIFAPYHAATDINDSPYVWGRSKGFISINIAATNEGPFANAFDFLSPSPRTWLADSMYTATYITFALPKSHCISGPSGSTISVTSSSISLGGVDTPAYAGSRGYTNVSWLWSTKTKPVGASNPIFGTATAASSTVNGLQNGTYVIMKQVTDNNTGIWADSVTVNVNISGGCTACYNHHKGYKHKIIIQ